MTLIRKFYDVTPGDGGGAPAPLPPTLGDITNPGGPTPAPAPAPDPAPVEGLNPDGTLQDGYIKDDQGKVIKAPSGDSKPPAAGADDTPPADEPPADEDDDPLAFYADVDKLRGETIEVTYPEGIHPQSPEGVYHREKVLEERAVQQFERALAKNDPRSYAYMLHRSEGGTDEDFFAEKTISLPDYEQFKSNVDLQSKVYKSSLVNKGLDDESAQALVDKAIKENKLFEKSDTAYRSAEKQMEDDLKAIEARNQENQQKYQSSLNTLSTQLTSAVTEGKGLNLVIPDADKAGFLAYLKDNVQHDRETNTFLFVQPIAADKMNRQIEALYLQYKDGDLNALIKRAANTQNARRIGSYVKKSKEAAGSNSNETAGKPTGYVPLGSL